MSKKTVLIALSIFLLAVLLVGGYTCLKQPKVPQQVKIFNSLLGNEMTASGNNWYIKEDNIDYALYNITGKDTGYTRAVIEIESKNATDLSKVDKIIASFFPDKKDEIMSEITLKQEKLNNHWLVGEAYKYAYRQNSITVKALDDQIPTIEIEIILPAKGGRS